MLDQAVNRTAVVTVGEVRTRTADAQRARHRDQQGRAQVPVRRRLPPRLPRVQRARREQQGAVVVRAHQRRGRHRRRERHSRSTASCGGRTDCSARIDPRGAHPSAALPGRSPGRIRRRSTRSWSRRRRSAERRCAAPSAKPRRPAHHQLPVDLRQGEGQSHPAARLPEAGGSHRDRRKRSAPTQTMAEEAGPIAVGDDPDYARGGGDSLVYRVPLSELSPASLPPCRRRSTTRRRRRSICRTASAPRNSERHQAAVLRRPASSNLAGTAGAGLEAAGRHQRSGDRAVDADARDASRLRACWLLAALGELFRQLRQGSAGALGAWNA